MKKWLILIAIIISISSIFIGNRMYAAKLETIALNAKTEHDIYILEQKERMMAEKERKIREEQERLARLTSGLDKEIVSLVKSSMEMKENIHVIAFGSQALIDSQKEGITPWPVLLEGMVNNGYDEELVHVETHAFGELTSLQILEEGYHTTVASLTPDIVIIEPFLLNDNGKVAPRDTFTVLTMIVDAFKRENEDIIVFVQPPQPVFQFFHYRQYGEQLKEYAGSRNYSFIDHWNHWPEIDNEDLLQYIGENHRMPTQEGHELWSKSVAEKFMND